MKIPQLPADKANHFAYGAGLAAVGALHSVVAGLALCAACAVLKEVYDRISRRGTPDAWDTVATVLGAVPVLVPLALWRAGVVA